MWRFVKTGRLFILVCGVCAMRTVVVVVCVCADGAMWCGLWTVGGGASVSARAVAGAVARAPEPALGRPHGVPRDVPLLGRVRRRARPALR